VCVSASAFKVYDHDDDHSHGDQNKESKGAANSVRVRALLKQLPLVVLLNDGHINNGSSSSSPVDSPTFDTPSPSSEDWAVLPPLLNNDPATTLSKLRSLSTFEIVVKGDEVERGEMGWCDNKDEERDEVEHAWQELLRLQALLVGGDTLATPATPPGLIDVRRRRSQQQQRQRQRRKDSVALEMGLDTFFLSTTCKDVAELEPFISRIEREVGGVILRLYCISIG
jgi:hypothetical protein